LSISAAVYQDYLEEKYGSRTMPDVSSAPVVADILNESGDIINTITIAAKPNGSLPYTQKKFRDTFGLVKPKAKRKPSQAAMLKAKIAELEAENDMLWIELEKALSAADAAKRPELAPA